MPFCRGRFPSTRPLEKKTTPLNFSQIALLLLRRQVAAAPGIPVPTSETRVPVIATDSGSEGGGVNSAGNVEPQATPAKAAAEAVRAKAKADAKARLR